MTVKDIREHNEIKSFIENKKVEETQQLIVRLPVKLHREIKVYCSEKGLTQREFFYILYDFFKKHSNSSGWE